MKYIKIENTDLLSSLHSTEYNIKTRYLSNSWKQTPILNLIPATDCKKSWDRSLLTLCYVTFSSNSTLLKSGDWRHQLSNYWQLNYFQFWLNVHHELLNCARLYFVFFYAQYISTGNRSGLHADQSRVCTFFIVKPCCCNWCRFHLYGSICKTWMNLSVLMVPQ